MTIPRRIPSAALATVVGVLIEVLVMLSVVKVVNRSQGWYERGAAVRRRVARAGPAGLQDAGEAPAVGAAGIR